MIGDTSTCTWITLSVITLYQLQGSNWMISPDPDSGQGEILSQNLEGADPVAVSNCATDAAAAGPFLVHHHRFGWREDRDLGRDPSQIKTFGPFTFFRIDV